MIDSAPLLVRLLRNSSISRAVSGGLGNKGMNRVDEAESIASDSISLGLFELDVDLPRPLLACLGFILI